MKKGATSTIFVIILLVMAVVGLFLFLSFSTPTLGKGFKGLLDLAPKDEEITLTSCVMSCDSAKRAATTGAYDSCTEFVDKYYSNSEYCKKDCPSRYDCDILIKDTSCECPLPTMPPAL